MLIWILIVLSVFLVASCWFAFRWLKNWTDLDSKAERKLRKRLRDYLAEEDAAEDNIDKLSKESMLFWWKENQNKD